ncbi:MAG: Gfo/Idh/MocA family oxidoreductase [Solirubrobacteraceae bacterium]
MSITTRIPLAVVGLGHLGRFHAENLATRVPGAELVRVMDVDESLASDLGGELGVAWSTDYASVLEDERAVGVVIVTPTSMHAQMIEQAAAAGKHVFTEKPLSLDLASSLGAIEAARRAGVCLQVGFHRRFDPDYLAAAQRLRAGELGMAHFFRSTQRDVHPPSSTRYLATDGDFFMDALIHDFDCARWMMGEIVEVCVCGTSIGSPIFGAAGDVDNAIVTLRFASGAIGVVDGSRAAGYGYEAGIELLGANATLRISSNRLTNVQRLSSGYLQGDCVEDFRLRFASAYVNELADFASAVRARRAPKVGGEEAVAAFRVAQAASRSHAERLAVTIDPVEPA